MKKEGLIELRERVFFDYQEWDVKCSKDGFQEASPTGEMDADGKYLTALIDAEIARQSVTDEAVQNMVQTFESFLSSRHDANWTGDTVSNQYLHDAILTALRQMRTELCEWIPVSERLPTEELASVLVYTKDGGVSEGQYYPTIKSWKQFRWSVENATVTHWMPLPQPPESEG